jgi:hypothetical protein
VIHNTVTWCSCLWILFVAFHQMSSIMATQAEIVQYQWWVLLSMYGCCVLCVLAGCSGQALAAWAQDVSQCVLAVSGLQGVESHSHHHMERAWSRSKAESHCIACTMWCESDYKQVDCYSKWKQDSQHCSRIPDTSKPLPQCAMKVENTNMFDLWVTSKDEICFCLNALLLKVLGISTFCEYLYYAVNLWKSVQYTLRHMLMKLHSQSFAL